MIARVPTISTSLPWQEIAGLHLKTAMVLEAVTKGRNRFYTRNECENLYLNSIIPFDCILSPKRVAAGQKA